MIKNLLKRRDLILVIGIVFFALICYQFAIKNTLDAYNQNQKLAGALNNNSVGKLPLDFMKRKSQNLDKILIKYALDSATFKGRAIGEVASIAEEEHLKLIEIPLMDPFYNTEYFLIQRIDFEGDYYSIVKFINRVQKQRNVGVLRSLSMKTQKKGNEKGKSIILELFLQIKK
ncbi:MAG: hypothetical protein H7Y07_07865 [Pyrinomonadaceae bacterium]|nr:hypothetical protein [Sphingobacteriaceae bacterium]